MPTLTDLFPGYKITDEPVSASVPVLSISAQAKAACKTSPNETRYHHFKDGLFEEQRTPSTLFLKIHTFPKNTDTQLQFSLLMLSYLHQNIKHPLSTERSISLRGKDPLAAIFHSFRTACQLLKINTQFISNLTEHPPRYNPKFFLPTPPPETLKPLAEELRKLLSSPESSLNRITYGR